MARSRQRADSLLATALLALDVGVGSVTDRQDCSHAHAESKERTCIKRSGECRRGRKRNSRAAKAVLRAGPLVLGAVLLETAVLGGLVLLPAGLATLLTLDGGVGAVTKGQRESAPSCQEKSRTYDPPKPCSEETRLSGVPSCLRPSCCESVNQPQGVCRTSNQPRWACRWTWWCVGECELSVMTT